MKREYLGDAGYPGWEYREELRYNEHFEEVVVGAVTNGIDKGFGGVTMRGHEKELREELVRRINDVENLQHRGYSNLQRTEMYRDTSKFNDPIQRESNAPIQSQGRVWKLFRYLWG